MDLDGPQLPLNDAATLPYRSTALKSVVLWAPEVTRSVTAYVHWRTSYYFQAPVGQDYGISIDAYMPEQHIYTAADVENFKASVLITPRNRRSIVTTGDAWSRTIYFDRGVPVSVADVVDLIRAAKYQFYEFNPDKRGCLFWQLRLLKAFATAGWIGASKPTDVLRELEGYQAGLRYRRWQITLPPVEGKEYDPAEFVHA